MAPFFRCMFGNSSRFYFEVNLKSITLDVIGQAEMLPFLRVNPDVYSSVFLWQFNHWPDGSIFLKIQTNCVEVKNFIFLQAKTSKSKQINNNFEFKEQRGKIKANKPGKLEFLDSLNKIKFQSSVEVSIQYYLFSFHQNISFYFRLFIQYFLFSIQYLFNEKQQQESCRTPVWSKTRQDMAYRWWQNGNNHHLEWIIKINLAK